MMENGGFAEGSCLRRALCGGLQGGGLLLGAFKLGAP